MPEHSFDEALTETIHWYQSNEPWWAPIKSGEFKEYYKSHYNMVYEGE
jgi:dTDP-glucose 4,6-dehydratase